MRSKARGAEAISRKDAKLLFMFLPAVYSTWETPTRFIKGAMSSMMVQNQHKHKLPARTS
eukprot:5981043-Amphidinium_carterae.1